MSEADENTHIVVKAETLAANKVALPIAVAESVLSKAAVRFVVNEE